MDPGSQPSSQRNLRQSCDKCRTRKQTCTKELGGCSRCRNLGIQCRYSVQKPTGRPRKATPHILRQPQVSNSGASHFAVGDMRILQTDTNLPAPTSIQFLNEHITDRVVSVSNSREVEPPAIRFSKDMDSCSCLSRIHYFTRVLRALTNEVVPSVTVVRTAVRSDHDSLKCSSCSRSMIISQDPTEKLRALGTLLSLIPGFYHQLLKMIDCEASLAVAESRGLAFKLEESGGLWGDLAGDKACPDVNRLKDHPLDPELWRQTMRGLLRADVYGLSVDFYSGDSGRLLKQGRHPGLNDMVGMLDELATRGLLGQIGSWLLPESTGVPTCMKLMETAKQSVGQLVIIEL